MQWMSPAPVFGSCVTGGVDGDGDGDGDGAGEADCPFGRSYKSHRTSAPGSGEMLAVKMSVGAGSRWTRL